MSPRFPVATVVAILIVALGLPLSSSQALAIPGDASAALARKAGVQEGAMWFALKNGGIKLAAETRKAKKVAFKIKIRNGKTSIIQRRVIKRTATKVVSKKVFQKTVRIWWKTLPSQKRWEPIYDRKNGPGPVDGVEIGDDDNEFGNGGGSEPTPPLYTPKYDHTAYGCEDVVPGSSTMTKEEVVARCTEYYEDEWSCLIPIQDVPSEYRLDRRGYDYYSKPYWYEMFCEPRWESAEAQRKNTVTMTRCVEKPDVGTLVELTYTVPIEKSSYEKYGRHDVRSYGIVPGSAKFNAVGDALTYTMADNKVLGDTATFTIPYITDPSIPSFNMEFVPEWSGRPLLSWANTAMYKRPVNYEQKMLGLPVGTARSTEAWFSTEDRGGRTSYRSNLMGYSWDNNNPCASLGVTETFDPPPAVDPKFDNVPPMMPQPKM